MKPSFFFPIKIKIIYWKTSGLYFPGRESAKGAFRKWLIRGSWWKIKSSSLYLAEVFLQANYLHFPSLFHIFSYLCVKEMESYQGLWKSQGKAGMSTCCHDALLFNMVHENQYWLVEFTMKIYRNPDISIPLSFLKDFLRHSLILFQQKKGKKTPVLSSFGEHVSW